MSTEVLIALSVLAGTIAGAVINGVFGSLAARIGATQQKPIDNVATVQKTVDLLESERERLIQESKDERAQHAQEIEEQRRQHSGEIKEQRRQYENRIQEAEARHQQDISRTNAQLSELSQQVKLLTALREEDQVKIQKLYSLIGQDVVGSLAVFMEKIIQGQQAQSQK